MKRKKILDSYFQRVDSFSLSEDTRKNLLSQNKLIESKIPKNGYRFYFLCKSCSNRKRFLYRVKENEFYCRTCLQLTYESSQCKNKFYRTWRLVSGRKCDFKYFRIGKKPGYKQFIISLIFNEYYKNLDSVHYKTLINVIEFLNDSSLD